MRGLGKNHETQTSFDIEKIFSYQNPKMQELRRLLDEYYREIESYKGLEGSGGYLNPLNRIRMSEVFSQRWKLWEKEKRLLRDFFREKLEDAILIDLGCGVRMRNPSQNDVIVKMIREFGVKQYIGIDFQNGNLLKEDGECEIVEILDGKGIFMGGCDMLETIAKAYPNSANIALNGIDGELINNIPYHDALAREIARVMKPSGIVFGIKSLAFNKFRELSLQKRKASLIEGLEIHDGLANPSYGLIFEKSE